MPDGEGNPSGERRTQASEDRIDAVGQPDIEDLRIRMPDVPDVPALPEAPTLKPDLPKLDKPNQTAAEARQMGIAYTIPAMLIAPIVLLTLLGYWLDGRYHHSPVFTLSGALLGAVSGLINMVRAAGKLND